MRYRNLILTDKDGVSTAIEYAFADDGKVFVDNVGNTVSCVERSKVADYTEVEEIIDPEVDDAEAFGIIFGGDAE
jgi:hypothetical protein